LHGSILLFIFRWLNCRFMKKNVWGLLFVIASLTLGSCKKDNQNFRNASLLLHQWLLKSVSERFSITGSYQGTWETKQASAVNYREFKSDGTWTNTLPGFSTTEPYQLLDDSILVLMHPATTTRLDLPPDTAYIRQISDSLFVWYSRRSFTSPNYASLSERIDTLVR
jgi:hypothetical protein